MIKIIMAMFLVAGVLCFSSCNNSKSKLIPIEKQATTESKIPNVHIVGVEEVLQANSYTYIKVSETNKDYWIAVSKMQVDTKAIYYFLDGLEMKNFVSKDLNRTFESIYFINKISLNPNDLIDIPVASQGGMTETTKSDVNVEVAAGGITIAELFANRQKYENKVVRIKGKVVKYNAEIMGKNWIHIQDGTESKGAFDLTITTSDIASLDEIVTFEGEISLNKDFGSGYSYEVIMENAKKLTNKKI